MKKRSSVGVGLIVGGRNTSRKGLRRDSEFESGLSPARHDRPSSLYRDIALFEALAGGTFGG